MQLPILRTYELDFYDTVRLFLKQDSKIFQYLEKLDTSHVSNGRIFIKGKFIKIKVEGAKQIDLPKAHKYYFIEASDVRKLKDPYLLEINEYSQLPKYVLEIDQEDVVSIELLLDYTVK